MLEIRCANDADGNGQHCGRFLGRLVGGVLQIYCPRCKMVHSVTVAELVRHMASEIPQDGNGETRLFL